MAVAVSRQHRRVTPAVTSWQRLALAPWVAPSQGETGPISIWPTDSAVVIQAPSSKPACTAPRRSAGPHTVIRESSVDITEPDSTATTPITGRMLIAWRGWAGLSAGWQSVWARVARHCRAMCWQASTLSIAVSNWLRPLHR